MDLCRKLALALPGNTGESGRAKRPNWWFVRFLARGAEALALSGNTRKLRRRTRLNGWLLRFLAPGAAALALLGSLPSSAQQPPAPAGQSVTPGAPAGASGRGGRGSVTAEITGDPTAGQAFFNGAGKCGTCHSVTGDLRGVGSRMNPTVLQGRMVYPRGNGGYPGFSVVTPQGAKPDRPKNATVTLADGTKYKGDVVAISDFIITLTDKDGVRRTFTRDGDVPKVAVTDPLQAHIDLMPKLTDKTMHDLTAYLVTLK